jgi:uncharacterized protein with LGFP repeats
MQLWIRRAKMLLRVRGDGHPQHRHRLAGLFALLLLASVAFHTGPAAAVAAPGGNSASSAPTGNLPTGADGTRKPLTGKALEKRLVQLTLDGVNDGRIASELGLVKVSVAGGGIRPFSSSNSIELRIPSMYRNPADNLYYVTSRFGWMNNQWWDDTNSRFGGTSNVGGYDGMGLRFSRPIVNYGGSLSYRPSNWISLTGEPVPSSDHWGWQTIDQDHASVNNASGTSFLFQDQIFAVGCGNGGLCAQYNAGVGVILDKVSFPGDTGCVEIGAAFGHDWGTTSLNGISVSLDGFGFSWTGGNQNMPPIESSLARINCGDPIADKYYNELGGASGPLGAQLFNTRDTGDGRGRFAEYQNGRIYATAQTGVHAVYGLIFDKFFELGAHGFFGYPTTDESGTPDGRGRFNHFDRGTSIYFTPQTGAHAVLGEIHKKWEALGWETGPLGYPTTDEMGTPDGRGRFNHFDKGGSIYFTPQTGAHAVLGEIHKKWEALGWETGPLGYPTDDESGTPDGRGRFNQFDKGGAIYFTPTTGAHAIYGVIYQKWAELTWERGPLGYPTTDETGTPDGRGRFNHFDKGGSIYWTSQTGAHAVYGSIRDKWRVLGWETGPLGYPTTDETGTPDGIGRYNHFERDASIYWTPAYGAHDVYGCVRDAWEQSGWEKGPWGYPTDDTVAIDTANGVALRGIFEHHAATCGLPGHPQ